MSSLGLPAAFCILVYPAQQACFCFCFVKSFVWEPEWHGDWYHHPCEETTGPESWCIRHGHSLPSHTSRVPWPCDCEGPWPSSKGRTNCLIDMVCHILLEGLFLGGGRDANSSVSCDIIRSLSCRNPCRRFIHDDPFLVWSELERCWAFSRSMRDLRMEWSWVFGLVCEVA